MVSTDVHWADVPPFLFRLEPTDVEIYRAALGAPGQSALYGMALRAITTGPVLDALRQLAPDCLPIHIGQEYKADLPLRIGVDYKGVIRMGRIGNDRLQIELQLTEVTGATCITLTSEIALVARGHDDD